MAGPRHRPNPYWPFRRSWWIALGVALALLLAVPTPAEDLPRIFQEPIQAYEIANLSDADEVALGQAIDQRLRQNGLALLSPQDSPVSAVSALGQRLAAVSDRPHLPYTIQVVEDGGINAFATMGGFIYVQTGLIRAAQNEAELASVLAHEIGHIEGRHGLNQLWHELIARDISAMADGQQKRLVDIGIELRLRSHSYAAEFAADQRAIAILNRAGYAPQGAITFLQRIYSQRGDAAEFLYSHPAPSQRLAALIPLVAALDSPATGGLDPAAYAALVSELP